MFLFGQPPCLGKVFSLGIPSNELWSLKRRRWNFNLLQTIAVLLNITHTDQQSRKFTIIHTMVRKQSLELIRIIHQAQKSFGVM